MDKNASYKIVRETFESDFDKNRFLIFVKNLLNELDESKAFQLSGVYIPESFREYIKSYERLGTYIDLEDKKIDVLVVYLQKDTSLERARTAQRNFVARYLRERDQKDAGLVAFVSPNSQEWRFSLVKMEYKFEEGKNGKVKVKEEFTPAKRWSFLVGLNENSHTAQSRLAPIVQNDGYNPTLNQLEEAFNIEKVTKEFFEKYRELFLRVHETLNNVIKNNPEINKDFSEKNANTVDFSKKLLGQIIFLYFLQKKGWFGVKKGALWGTGSKQFLRDLFDKRIIIYNNFFNDVLEPLFYDALARDRSDIDHWNDHFQSKIPFLNGGLFDPISNYDWVNTDINLPNELFSNTRKTRDGDTGDGILDVFDRYNFTVKEDEPLEKEVAIDPEMLGQVFENLLEVKDRKSKGTYYTPREIVHYMCEQSLVNYLATELKDKVSNEDLEKLIKIGENVVEHEAIHVAKKENDPDYKGQYDQILPVSIEKYAKEIDEKLATIKVCDPAIGSGAFPVGMMNAIVKARRVLTSYLKDKNRTLYDFKRDCIQNSLYGVDIDPGAVEIAKLRLWLSLVVDEDDIKQIKPLPNLDYKIMQGNSLLEEFEGIKLFDEKLLAGGDKDKEKQLETLKQRQSVLQKEYIELHSKNKLTAAKQAELDNELRKLMTQVKKLSQTEKGIVENAELFDIYSEAKKKADELKRLHEEFFEATQKSKKDNIKRQIEKLEWELIEATLKEQNKISALKKLEEFKRSNTKPFFLWKLNFSDVFEEKGGFDVVIANPPYVRADSPDYKAQREAIIKSKRYDTLYEKWDLFIPFIERGLRLLSNSGNLSYITSNSLLTSKFAFRLLEFIQNHYTTQYIDYFSNDTKVFDAGVVPVVFGIAKQVVKPNVRKTIHQGAFNHIIRQEMIPIADFKVMGKEAFKLSTNSFKSTVKTISLGNICYLSYGLRPNSDERFWRGEFTRDDLVLDAKDKNHPVQYIEGKHIDYYRINNVLYLEWGTARVPKKLVRPTFPELYVKPKLLRGTMTGGTYDDTGIVCNHSIVVFVRFIDLTGIENKSISGSLKKFNTFPRTELEIISTKFDLKYLLAILNSKFANNFLNSIRRHRLENYFYPDDYRKLPIADITSKNQKPFVDLVEDILKITRADNYLKNAEKQAKVNELEHQIDELVYKLYNLTDEEIKFMESN